MYTINLESRYLLVQGVPALGAMRELVERFALYGAIEQYNALDEYPAEEFTEVYLIKFLHLHSARYRASGRRLGPCFPPVGPASPRDRARAPRTGRERE